MSLASRGIGLPQVGRNLSMRRSYGLVVDFVALTKPRVMSLVLFTALVGLMTAPGQLGPGLSVVALLCIAGGAGGAAALNMWYDADIDAVMARTATRPIPAGRVSRASALKFGLTLAAVATVILGSTVNLVAAALLALTIAFYIGVYTIWLKRRTPQNIVIGGAAGALPPMVGWAAVTGHVGVEPCVLFLIIFLWTPVHFWALSLNHAGEYARAGIPMLPVVAGRPETKKQILIYSICLPVTSVMPWILGFAGVSYGVTAVVLGIWLILLTVRLHRSSGSAETSAANRLFAFSIVYLFLLFAVLLVEAAARS